MYVRQRGELYFILREGERTADTKVALSRSSVNSGDVGTRRAHGITGVITCQLTGCIGINDDKSVATHAIATVTGDYFFSRQPAWRGPQLAPREILPD